MGLLKCSHRLALLVSLPILFSTANGQQRPTALTPPQLLRSSTIAAARPLPLPDDATQPVAVAGGSASVKGAVHLFPVSFERLPPVEERQSQSLIGKWKSFASSLLISSGGSIELQLDMPRYPMTKDDAEIRIMAGVYELQDDLLLVRWEDGSHSNFRWQLTHSHLLLTDEMGRTSRLTR